MWSDNRKPLNLPPFTLIGATTDEYLLTTSMRDRFKILLRLTHCSDDEMALLIHQRAKRKGWQIDADSVQTGREVSVCKLQCFGEELLVPSGALSLSLEAVGGGMMP
jgi:hypothetical protein